ncbi:hypothetical protein RHSIM_Rhsim09G0160700 [Rhododendron simsii]|uniref:MULE transposase domain-containing protein n=1 Tax=Rhododendron simsii TaxID=118357 RepID=A0A834GJ47_RHOSS|nr:hypothetical protein RHSIM_Rhsim09G0160700 [Rhododendron simsii]
MNVHLLHSHRKVTPVQKCLMQQLGDANMPPFQQMSILELQSGGLQNVGFTKKDLYNDRRDKKKLVYGHDGNLMYEYLQSEKEKNHGFAFTFETDDEQRMTHWVNHHGQTTLFGCAFLSDDTCESFEWFFKEWLKAMPGGPPKMIITDQDPAMAKAIASTLPDTYHRFDGALSNLRHNELDLDHKDVNEKPVLKTSSLLEKRMSELYTGTIFYKFQEEIHQKDAYVFMKTDEDEHRCLWNVQRAEWKVQDVIMALPDEYILRRWTVAAKASMVLDDLGGERGKEICSDSMLMRRHRVFQRFSNVVDDAILTEEGTQILEEALESVTKRVALMKISREDGEGSGIRVPICLGSQLTYKEPLQVRRKGLWSSHDVRSNDEDGDEDDTDNE